MDQLKTFLAAAKKHHFWLLCGLAVLVGLAFSWSSATKLSTTYKDQKQKISTTVDSLNKFVEKGDHPNDQWVKEVEKKDAEFRQQVYNGWAQRYRQQKDKVFVWPKDLGPEFIAAFASDPSKATTPQMSPLRDMYQTYIVTRALPRLAAIVDAEWSVQNDNSAADGQRSHDPAAQAVEGHKVVWDDQQRLYSLYNWQSPPSEQDIRAAQTDMWVLQALFEAIRRANSEATGSFDAVVRTILESRVGYDATSRFPLGEGESRVQRFTPGSAAPETVVQSRRPGDRGGRSGRDLGDPSAPRSRSSRSLHAQVVDPSGPAEPVFGTVGARFVDAKGKPITAAESTGEYKLMAFKLRLEVDEARFQRVIQELANSTLPLLVREVRLNISSDNHPIMAPNGGADNVMHTATLEIRGVAYLIDPPDPKKLGMPDAATTESPATATESSAAARGPSTTPATGGAASGTGATPAGAGPSTPGDGVLKATSAGGAATATTSKTESADTGATATTPAKGAADTATPLPK